jgi:hypothetical protein
MPVEADEWTYIDVEITNGTGTATWNFEFVQTSTAESIVRLSGLVITQLTSNGRTPINYDWSGNGINATQTTVAAQPFIATAGVLEEGLRFAGGQWLDTGSETIGDGLFAGSDRRWTVSIWVKYTSRSSAIIGRAGATGSSRTFYVLSPLSDSEQPAIQLRGSNNNYNLSFGDGNWHFLTITWDGTTAKLWADGQFRENPNVGTAAEEVGQRFIIGARTNGAGAFLGNGNIAFVGIWDRAITETEIETVYNLTDPLLNKYPNLYSYEAETIDYIRRVDNKGGEVLAPKAVNSYFKGLKDESLWDKIKASALFAGVDFEGCFVPLRADMPTPENVNFTDARHNPITGLRGDASSMLVNIKYANNADGRNNAHRSVYMTLLGANQTSLMAAGTTGDGSDTLFISADGRFLTRSRSSGVVQETMALGFLATSRLAGANYTSRSNKTNVPVTRDSQVPVTTDLILFARGTATSPELRTDARLATYTAGDGLTNAELANLNTLQENLLANIATELA